MAKFNELTLSDGSTISIEWDMTPDLAFCMFSAKGLRDELNSGDERVCYFFIDNYGESPILYLMERGNRFVNILAEVDAPGNLLNECINRQGHTLNVKDNFPVDESLKNWIVAEVIEKEDSSLLHPTRSGKEEVEDFGDPLPWPEKENVHHPALQLPDEPCYLTDEQIEAVIKRWGCTDKLLNKDAIFVNHFVAGEDELTVIDEHTKLMWQRFGLDLCSIRNMKSQIKELNSKGFSGHHDWRMPTVEEACSLMEVNVNKKGMFLHPCFSKEQPFIFTSARRKPTGYWFVDYKQGKVYWSSGTVPGGFCRLCRNVNQEAGKRSAVLSD